MNVKITYRLFSLLLVCSLFTGLMSTWASHSEMKEHCSTSMNHNSEDSKHDSMQMELSAEEDCCGDSISLSHHGKKEQSTSDSCQMSIECICCLTPSVLKKEGLLTPSVKITGVLFTTTIYELYIDSKQQIPPPLLYSNSHSPPILFLVNQSFLI